MKNDKVHIFSEKYMRKKEAILRSVKRTDKTGFALSPRVPAKIIATAILACVMFTVTAFAAVKLGVFNIRRGEDKTVVQIGGTDSIVADDVITDMPTYVTIISRNKEKGEVPNLIFHRDYMPEGVEKNSEGSEIKYGEFENGRSLSFDVTYLGGEGFTLNLGAGANIEEFEVNGHDALLVNRGETLYFNKILAVYFEEEDVLALCYAGYGISEDEVRSLAEGLRFEKTENVTLAYPITHNYGEVNLGESVGNRPAYLPLETAEKISLGDTVVFNDTVFKQVVTDDSEAISADIEITPVSVKILDDVTSLNTYSFRELFEDYMDANGKLIVYPRTEIIKGEGTDPDSFGETKKVKKKLVLIELKMKNMSNEDIWSYTVGDISLHLGNGEDKTSNYVFDKVPQKNSTTSLISYYDAGCGGKQFYKTSLGAGEELTCHIGFLVDEDMTDEVYVIFGGVDTKRHYLKITE